ncbi:MAG: YlbF family regulator [Lachnospiraceae bacterium]|jgi:cell fate (sporulation/competence/biofilm development) regulator YlbF (YheA/YmcA/DUF963 family)|nr:YlbF family regulator [Lachnospiraceae bacterium]
MNQIDACIEKLIDAILTSEAYQQYLSIREKVKQSPGMEQAIHEFRRRNFQMRKDGENLDLYEEIDRLGEEFAKLRSEPLVNEYLAAELAVCRLFQKINRSLLEQVEFDLGFDE